MEPDLTAQDAISQRELVSRQADDPHAEAPLVLSSRSQEDAKESETKYTIDNVPEKGEGDWGEVQGQARDQGQDHYNRCN